MARSKRHHYLPRFYTKGFTDTDNHLFVYDKSKDIILKTKKSPKSVFYGWDRNTVAVHGEPHDQIEKTYAALDDLIARSLTEVLKSGKLKTENLTSLILFTAQLKWRTPKADQHFNSIKDELNQQDLRIKIALTNKDSDEYSRMINYIEESPMFKESKRVILSFLAFQATSQFEAYHKFSLINTNPVFPALIGDNPVLEYPGGPIDELNDFILPLSGSCTLLYKKGLQQGVTNALFFWQRDMTMIEFANQYVGCNDKMHLERVVSAYRAVKKDGKGGELIKYLFHYIQ